jgi:CO/xanthine dehydrogenase Mo-binding subunit
MAQIAAEEFGVSMDDVSVVFSDTLYCPYFAGGSTSSRVTYNLGNAVRLACVDAKRGLCARAAEALEVSPDALDIKDKEIFIKDSPDIKIGISELFFAKATGAYAGVTGGREALGDATYIQDFTPEDPETGQIDPSLAAQGKRLCGFYSHTAKGAEVAVDVETGQVRVLRLAAATDLGKAINPKACEQQSEGGIGMGIGSAIYEEMVMDRGTVTNPGFHDYRLPSTTVMPLAENVKSMFVESAPHKDGPFGAKGFAEGAVIGTEPAIANAIYDAVGIRIKDLPITPEKILKALGKL